MAQRLPDSVGTRHSRVPKHSSVIPARRGTNHSPGEFEAVFMGWDAVISSSTRRAKYRAPASLRAQVDIVLLFLLLLLLLTSRSSFNLIIPGDWFKFQMYSNSQYVALALKCRWSTVVALVFEWRTLVACSIVFASASIPLYR